MSTSESMSTESLILKTLGLITKTFYAPNPESIAPATMYCDPTKSKWFASVGTLVDGSTYIRIHDDCTSGQVLIKVSKTNKFEYLGSEMNSEFGEVQVSQILNNLDTLTTHDGHAFAKSLIDEESRQKVCNLLTRANMGAISF